MWCKTCNIETNATVCPICGETTVEDLPIEIRWCEHCKTPIINEQNQISKECPLCGGTTKYISTDLRPVFPEERLLLEVLLDKEPTYGKKNLYGRVIIAILLMENRFLFRASYMKN